MNYPIKRVWTTSTKRDFLLLKRDFSSLKEARKSNEANTLVNNHDITPSSNRGADLPGK
jgi:hypothetical protein